MLFGRKAGNTVLVKARGCVGQAKDDLNLIGVHRHPLDGGMVQEKAADGRGGVLGHARGRDGEQLADVVCVEVGGEAAGAAA